MSEPSSTKKHSQSKITLISINVLLIVTLLVAIVWGISTYFHLDHDLYTNDAQIEEYINPVNARIPGYVREVRFSEHQKVRKGDTLVLIDDSEFKIQLEQAEAAYLSALAAKSVTSTTGLTVQSNLGVSEANIQMAEARLWNAEQNYHRFENLLKDSAATQQQFDQAKSEYNALQAQTQSLVQQRHTTSLTTNETSKKLMVSDAEIKRAHAAVEMARLNLSYTKILAPYDGITGRRNIEEGQLLQAGQTIVSFVRNNNKWVVANYRETQVTKLHIGQRMKINIDGFGDKVFYGHISAISEATGAKYSAIPVDNATGNFVKVQQRIPVKIEFNDSSRQGAGLSALIAGMNVEVRADE